MEYFLTITRNIITMREMKIIHLKKISIAFVLILCGFFTQLLAKDSFAIVPVSYQGRFLPAESYANQWIYHFSHTTLPKNDLLKDPLDLLWQLHFFGHDFLDPVPFFWISQVEIKKTLDLDAKKTNFSYEALSASLNHPKTNLQFVKTLLLYHFSKAYLSSANRSGRTTLELTALAPDLWLKWNGSTLVVLKAPSTFPWQWLKTDRLISDEVNLQTLENSLNKKASVEEMERLIADYLRMERLTGNRILSETAFEDTYHQLVKQVLSSKEISLQLEQQHPLAKRLANSGELLKVLPGRFKQGEWYPLNALEIQVFNSNKGTLELAHNFTLYSDTLFNQIRENYFQLKEAVRANKIENIAKQKELLGNLLIEGYQNIAQTPYLSALDKKLYYPSLLKLEAEAFYYAYPLALFCEIGYGLAFAFFLLAFLFSRRDPPESSSFSRPQKPKGFIFETMGLVTLSIAFLLHTMLLALRCYILERPPVANMLETVIYVPWVAVLVSLILRVFNSSSLPLLASAASSFILLILMSLNFYANSFENVQAVLDSHYWLFIHVLMVVGSYGLFLLASLMGHIYLGGIFYHRMETPLLRVAAQLILKVLYIGVIMLVAGTLLGGVWAAQSWGRFWDWDPKESWAFISICIYLLWIHAYRFGKIHHFGLAVGAILGFLAISFTWYGVNYILGTGLHSYGFGSGGIHYYYGYIFFELLFLAAMIQKRTLLKRDVR